MTSPLKLRRLINNGVKPVGSKAAGEPERSAAPQHQQDLGEVKNTANGMAGFHIYLANANRPAPRAHPRRQRQEGDNHCARG